MIGIYHYDGSRIYVRYKSVIYAWLREVAKREGFVLGDISIVLCSSEEHRAMNRYYLKHDYYTDVLTFDDSDPDTNIIDGDIIIDRQTTIDNAKIYGATSDQELYRVMVHGVLHLCGQSDKIDVEEKIMHKKEDRYLALFEEMLAAHIEKEKGKVRRGGKKRKAKPESEAGEE